MKITAHVLVENEENFIWYAVMSVARHVDEIILFDAGSRDKTPEILREIKNRLGSKIKIDSVGKLSAHEYPRARQKMLDLTKDGWIIIVDGDEVWWEEGIMKLVNTIKSKDDSLDTIVTRYKTCIMDIYHYQDESLGKYVIGDEKGHITIRAINRGIKGLHVDRRYPFEGFYNGENTLIQNLEASRRIVLPEPGYLHLTHLTRTSVHKEKVKYDKGIAFPLDYYYPEVLFREKPSIVPDPWKVSTLQDAARAGILHMPRKVKRWIK